MVSAERYCVLAVMSAIAPICLALGLSMVATMADARTIVVGPGQAVSRIADAARIANDGDEILILPGEYRGDVAVWRQRALTLRGVGERPVLIADGADAEGKAIWVIRNGDFVVENIEFRGTRVASGNGAGIRFEGGRLEVRDSAFIDNQNGILTSNNPEAELIVRDSVFADAPRPNPSLPHLLYVGRIARFELTGSQFHNGFEGHLVKSRARENLIRYNLLFDGAQGEASYELEFPDGGLAEVVGNVIGQSAATRNLALVSYGAESLAWPENRLILAHNTLYSEGMRPARFVHVWTHDDTPPASVEAYNNLVLGVGALQVGAGGVTRGNVLSAAGALRADILDFRPGSHLLPSLRASAVALPPSLRPTAEFHLPVGTCPIEVPLDWISGAMQPEGRERSVGRR